MSIPAGNPHVQTDPRNMRIVAAALAKRLAAVDPAHAAGYAARAKAFDDALGAGIAHWQQMAAPLKGKNVISYHKGWVYLLNFLDMREVATIEPKPGVPPGSAYIADCSTEIPHLKRA